MTPEARILNVNDDDANRYLVTRMLQRAGFEVLEAATGLEALQKLEQLPDLVILDVQLPDLDGFEVARRIRAHPTWRLMPVLHLSAHAVTSQAQRRGLESGADGYLTQPVEAEELVATIRAVLRARRSERELRLSLEQSSVILRNIADAVTAQDATGRVVYANDAARNVLGLPGPTQADGELADLLAEFEILDEHGAPLPAAQLPGRLVLDGAPGAEATIRWRRRGSREERWTVVRSCPVRDEAGRVQLAVNIVHDVTERRRGIERMMLLNEASAILTALYDPDQTLQRLAELLVSRVAERCLIELTDGDATGAPRYEHPADVPLDPALRARIGEAQTEATASRSASLRSLGTRWLLIAPMLVRNRSLGALALLSAEGDRYREDDLRLAEDLAHRTALTIDNARLFADARRAAEMRKELVAVVAHDLKNPLNAIGMAAALLGKQPGSTPEADRVRRQAGIVARATDRMNRLIHDLLDVSAIDAGALAMDRQRVSVRSLLNEAFELMTALAQQKPITLERELPAEDLTVMGDRERLLQVFSNLIGNAIKFTPAGGRVVIAAQRRDGRVQFSVADTGPGIEPEHLPHVFDRYWRVRKHSRDGTGLGLSIVKGIVDAHGGTVSADTVFGQGATFRFDLPLVD